MSLTESVLLGILQGITEFLPISSSGHLVFAQHLLKLKNPPIFFDCLLHFGTLVAVTIFFWKKIISLLTGFFDKNKNKETIKYLTLLILTTTITGIIGITLDKPIEKMFESPLTVSVFLMITGFIIWFGQLKMKNSNKTISEAKLSDSIIIGLSQGIAILPGISRSGTTISCGVILGWGSEFAAEYSFLASIPAILGANILKGINTAELTNSNIAINYIIGMIVSSVVGYFSLKLLWKLLVQRNWLPFAYYCWIVGIVMFILFLNLIK